MDDESGDKAPKQSSATGSDGVAHNTSQPVIIGPDDWVVLTPDNFRQTASPEPNWPTGVNQNRDNVIGEESSHSGAYSGATHQSQYSPLLQQDHMGSQMGGETNLQSSLQSRIDPVLLAQDSFTSSATSPNRAIGAHGYQSGTLITSGTDWYNEGLAAGASAGGAQNQQRIGTYQNFSQNGSCKTTDTEGGPSVNQHGQIHNDTDNSSISSGHQNKWAFINKVPADFETPRGVGRYFRQTILPSLNIGPSHQNQPYPSVGATNASRLSAVAGGLQSGVPEPSGPVPGRIGDTGSTLEVQMPQSGRSATDASGVLIPSHHQHFGIPQVSSVSFDSRQLQASGLGRSSSEMQNEAASYRNYGAAGLSANGPPDNDTLGVQTLSVSPGREDPMNSRKPHELQTIPAPALSGPSYGTPAVPFDWNQISTQQGVGQFRAPPQQHGNGLNNMDSCFISTSTPPTHQSLTDHRELQQPQQSLELQFGGTVNIPDQLASQTSTQTLESVSADMRQRIMETGPPLAGQPGRLQLSASLPIGMRSQMSPENFTPSSAPVIQGTGSQPSGNSGSGNDVQPAGARIGATGTDPATAQPGDFSQIPADTQPNHRSAPQPSQLTSGQAISEQVQVSRAGVADQVQPYTAPANPGPSGAILQSTATPYPNRDFRSSDNINSASGVDQHNIPIATPTVAHRDSIAAPLPLASAQHGTNNQGFPGPVQHQDDLLDDQPVPQQSAPPTERLRRNRNVPNQAIAMAHQYNLRALSSGQRVPVSAANNQAEVSGRPGINPGRAVTPVVAQPGDRSSVPAPVTSKKRQRKRGSGSSASKPAAKRARLTPPETQVGSSRTGAKGVVDPRIGEKSGNGGSSSSAPIERNTNYPHYGYFLVNPGSGSQQQQPVGRASAPPGPPIPTGAYAGPQNNPAMPQAAHFRGQPNPAILEQMLEPLPAMIAEQDAILTRFEQYQQVYGPSLYAFYMGDETSNPRPELRMQVTEQDEADMQDQGQALLEITQAISNNLLLAIMNMTTEQSAPHFDSLMYFCSAAALRDAVPVVERVANARLMACLIMSEQDRWRELADGAEAEDSATDPNMID